MGELGDEIFRDMVAYTDEVIERAHKDAKRIRNQMKPRLEAASPVRQYSTHTQEVKRIVVHRGPSHRKAVKEVKEPKYQPGYFRIGWDYGTITTGGRKIYGVRNKNMPTVTHLLNFGHELEVHGKRVGSVEGTGLVDTVQEWGTKELEKALSEYLEKE